MEFLKNLLRRIGVTKDNNENFIGKNSGNEILDKLKLDDMCNDLASKIKSENSRIDNLKKSLESRLSTIENLKTARDTLSDRLNRQRTILDGMRGRAQMLNKNMALNRYLAFAQAIGTAAEECRASVYLAHGVQALPAVDRLRELTGGMSACDVIEIPSFARRAIPSQWDISVLKTIDHALAGYLREADFLTTVGWALADLITAEHGYDDVRVIPNYRHFEEFPYNTKIKDQFSIPENATVVLCISKIASGFEDVLHAISKLGANLHIVTIGNFVPDSYRDEIEQLRDTLGLQGRVHFRGPVPYAELGAFCAGADVGLIVRDPAIANNHISLPNRVFDYLASNLPIVSPLMPDIHRILSENDCGVTIPDITPEAWADGIGQALMRKDHLRANAAKAAARYTWESLENDGLHAAFNHTDSITFVGFNNLAKNNRTMRMAASLVAKGVHVKVASPLEDNDNLPDGVEKIALQKF
jgi:hypothetical protein